MNIDFAADDGSPSGWWPEQPVQEPENTQAPAENEVSESENYDFGADLQNYGFPTVYKDFNDEPPAPIDESDPLDEERQSAVLASITNMAYSGGLPKAASVSRKRKHNPFFYRRTPSFSEAVARQKEILEPQKAAIEHIDEEVENRLVTYEKELASALEKNIAAVREFFLKEVDPLSLGIQGGTAQVHTLMNRIFPEGIETEQFSQFINMAKQARKIKMANFIAEYMGLSAEDAERIADSLTPRKEVMVIGPNLNERMDQRPPELDIQKKPRTRERIRMAAERERVGTNEISVHAPRERM